MAKSEIQKHRRDGKRKWCQFIFRVKENKNELTPFLYTHFFLFRPLIQREHLSSAYVQ
jgi:hypothetical protein